MLAADAVQKVGNGHPGTAMSVAPLAYTLFQKCRRLDAREQLRTAHDMLSFLSPRTVGWHLGRIFAKRSIMSRKQLRS